MYIDKAIKKQKKQYKNFMLIMCFIFLMLPIILFATGLNKNIFLFSYLLIIEAIVLLAIFIKFNMEKLKFNCVNNRLRIVQGVYKKTNIILCNKVELVHTEGKKEDIKIIIVICGKFRNQKTKPITEEFIKKYPMLSDDYLRLKRLNPENKYYYTVVTKGALKKYSLLDIIYRNCVKAIYTESSVENIKVARNQKDIT